MPERAVDRFEGESLLMVAPRGVGVDQDDAVTASLSAERAVGAGDHYARERTGRRVDRLGGFAVGHGPGEDLVLAIPAEDTLAIGAGRHVLDPVCVALEGGPVLG